MLRRVGSRLISIVSILITDELVDSLGVSLVTCTVLFAVALAATFAAWYRKEGTLSIHSIYTARREAFYWTAILFTSPWGRLPATCCRKASGWATACPASSSPA